MAYYYLISSLPMLTYGEPALIKVEEFVSLCADWVSADELTQLKALDLCPPDESTPSAGSAIDRWYEWETTLRNRIARTRASSLSKDADPHVRHETDYFSEVERGVQDAFGNPSPLERERVFDRMRWRQLEDQESGHHFDFDILCIYKVKLMLIEKWDERTPENGKENLDKILSAIVEPKSFPVEKKTA